MARNSATTLAKPNQQAAKLDRLTAKQAELLPLYREKWRAIALTEQPIDRQLASAAVSQAYQAMGFSAPEMAFHSSPSDALNAIALNPMSKELQTELASYLKKKIYTYWQKGQLNRQNIQANLKYILGQDVTSRARQLLVTPTSLLRALVHQLRTELREQLSEELIQKIAKEMNIVSPRSQRQLEQQLGGGFKIRIANQMLGELQYQLGGLLEKLLGKELSSRVIKDIGNSLWKEIDSQPSHELHLQYWDYYPGLFDFCISVLNCQCQPETWQAFQSLVQDCGWIYAAQETVLICDRPQKIALNADYTLHANGETSLQFADGYSIYSYEGGTLPKKYGAVAIKDWQVQWIAQEKNPQIKQILIQGIGRQRIFAEVPPHDLASFLVKNDLKIKSITSQEEKLLLPIQQKWAAATPKAISQGEIEPAIASAYSILGKTAPTKILREPPEAAFHQLLDHQTVNEKFSNLISILDAKLRQQLRQQIIKSLHPKEITELVHQSADLLADDSIQDITQLLKSNFLTLPLKELSDKLEAELDLQIDGNVKAQILGNFEPENKKIFSHFKNELLAQLVRELDRRCGDFLVKQIGQKLKSKLLSAIKDYWQNDPAIEEANHSQQLEWDAKQYATLFEFSTSILECQLSAETWQVFQSLVNWSQEIYTLSDTCVALDRRLIRKFELPKAAQKTDGESENTNLVDNLIYITIKLPATTTFSGLSFLLTFSGNSIQSIWNALFTAPSLFKKPANLNFQENKKDFLNNVEIED